MKGYIGPFQALHKAIYGPLKCYTMPSKPTQGSLKGYIHSYMSCVSAPPSLLFASERATEREDAEAGSLENAAGSFEVLNSNRFEIPESWRV